MNDATDNPYFMRDQRLGASLSSRFARGPRPRLRQLTFAAAAAAVLVGCTASTEGALRIPSSEDGLRLVTYTATEDPRQRAVGNIRATNASDRDDVVIDEVRLQGAHNVKVGSAWVIPAPADGTSLGSGFPVPPHSSDPEYAEHSALWAQRQDAAGATVAPGESVVVVVGLVQQDKEKCGSVRAVDVSYRAGHQSHTATWHTRYVLTPIGSDDCP